MKYVRTWEQLEEALSSFKAVMLVIVDPNEFMPAKSLLNYLHNHPLRPQLDHLILIWNTVEVQVYQKMQVKNFPHCAVLNSKTETLFAFVGYNRQLADQALGQLTQAAGLGSISKRLVKGGDKCRQGHKMVEGLPSHYLGGCFSCDSCHRLNHSQPQKPALHCPYCEYDLCWACAYQDTIESAH